MPEAECPTCGDQFAQERHMKSHHKQAHGRSLKKRSICEYCDEEFIVRRTSNPNKYCSIECKGADQRKYERRECEQCGGPFSVKRSEDTKYCCHPCATEALHDRPRPDDIESLLWLLYVYEGYSHTETFRRQRAVMGHENRLLKKEVKEKLKEMDVFYDTTSWDLRKMDPEDIGGDPAPEGDERFKRYYNRGAADD